MSHISHLNASFLFRYVHIEHSHELSSASWLSFETLFFLWLVPSPGIIEAKNSFFCGIADQLLSFGRV